MGGMGDMATDLLKDGLTAYWKNGVAYGYDNEPLNESDAEITGIRKLTMEEVVKTHRGCCNEPLYR